MPRSKNGRVVDVLQPELDDTYLAERIVLNHVPCKNTVLEILTLMAEASDVL